MAEPAPVAEALDALIPFDKSKPQPVTPHPEHATIQALEGADEKSQAHGPMTNLTPPPSTQINLTRTRDRTPTPTYSSISTPPPTVDMLFPQQSRLSSAIAATMSAEQINTATTEELRIAVMDLQSAYQEAKMNAAHYKLQYQMLAQESEAALERMDVEARMAQHENEIIHIAEQTRAAATAAATVTSPTAPRVPSQEGFISVQKDLYQVMCLEIQQLHRNTEDLQKENVKQDRLIGRQEAEIETLSERVSLLRERIRSNREHLNHLRKPAVPESNFSQSTYATPSRAAAGQDQFAALLQASEIARKEANPGRKPSHGSRSGNAYRQVTMTPQRYQKPPTVFATPGQVKSFTSPATVPAVGSTTFRSQDVYSQLRASQSNNAVARVPGPRSEDTVSNSDRDIDSEADTDILEPDGEVSASQASIKASLMLRNSHETDLDSRNAAAHPMKAKAPSRQSTLFGAVMKHGIDRSDSGRPSKRSRTDGIGLGITGGRH